MNPSPPEILTFKSKEQLAGELAGMILTMAWSAGKNGRDFNIALSGGSTPGILFKHLAELTESSPRETWEKINLYWVDERCVPPESPDSNFRMTNETLLQKIKVSPGNIFRMKGENVPEDETVRYSLLLHTQLPNENNFPVFDLILLGMGSDGHTASIFPDQMDLLSSEEVCAIGYHPETGQARITLTGRVINNARQVFFLITGEDKAITLEKIIGKGSSDERYPASFIKPSRGILKWFLDDKAASCL